ncbi:MAG: hypothetical protein AAB284_04435, partial [Chloroflexota bacterium]
APIDAVQVGGARHVAAQRAIDVAALRGVPVFRASSADARRALLELQAIRDARVELFLPGSARVALIEREAAGRWVVGTVEWFVDADGILFPSVDPTAAPALRVMDERTPARTAGERIDPQLVAAALRVAKIAPGELRADAVRPAVRATAGADGLVLASGAGWEIRFGTPERIDEKLELVRRFLREQPDRRLEYVDVRSPDRIVFSPR